MLTKLNSARYCYRFHTFTRYPLSHMLQVDIVEAGAIPLLVRLLSVAQPDGQYSAAAALFNLATYSTHVQDLIVAANALPALVPMLTADSWCVGAWEGYHQVLVCLV